MIGSARVKTVAPLDMLLWRVPLLGDIDVDCREVRINNKTLYPRFWPPQANN